MLKNALRPVHPGEILSKEFMLPLGLSSNALAKALHVTPARINDIVLLRRGISADTAIRLSHYFGTTPEFWLNLQCSYELKTAQLSFDDQIEHCDLV